MDEKNIKNVIVDTRKNVRYVIMADKKLNRNEMLAQIRHYNLKPYHIRTKRDSIIEIIATEDV